MKSIITLLLINLSFVSLGFAQSDIFALHISNPLGMYQKAGLKLEYKQKQMGLLITGLHYYGVLPKYPGSQIGFEGRYYNQPDSGKMHQNFLYSKIYYGHQRHVNQSGEGFFNRAEVPAGDYYGAGIGVGRHFNYRHFFIDLNAGFKYTFTEVNQATAFFITGPGSYLDLHLNLGLHLFH
jgi:hypothetical protein